MLSLPSRHPSSRGGFSFIELVVILLISTILAGVILPRFVGRHAAARDARRVADVALVREAIEKYHFDLGYYPPPMSRLAFGGWDVSQDGDFIPELLEKGYLQAAVNDPLDSEMYHYRYYVYDQGTSGCGGNGPFYVLGITRFELADSRDNYPSYFRCPGRNWSAEFDYVCGGGPAFQ